MTEENYYRLNIAQVGEWYEWGATALDAIQNAKDEMTADEQDFGAITARPAVYKEWIHGSRAYTNGGQFLGRDI